MGNYQRRFRIRIKRDQAWVPCTVVVDVTMDLDAIARKLANKAACNRASYATRMMGGSIKAKLIDIQEEVLS